MLVEIRRRAMRRTGRIRGGLSGLEQNVGTLLAVLHRTRALRVFDQDVIVNDRRGRRSTETAADLAGRWLACLAQNKPLSPVVFR